MRCGWCRECEGDLRDSDAADHALRGREDAEQQAVPTLHKTRDILVRQRTALINKLREHLGEYGVILGKGLGGVTMLVKLVHEAQGLVPAHARSTLHTIAAQSRVLVGEIGRKL